MAEKALRVNPRDGDPHIMMANYYAMLNDRTHALRHLDEALNLNPENPEYLDDWGRCHNRFGEKDQALGWLERARSRGFSPPEIRASPELDNLRKRAPISAAYLRKMTYDGAARGPYKEKYMAEPLKVTPIAERKLGEAKSV